MNKKDLLEFIERVESKAIRSIDAKWKIKVEEKQNEVMSKYDEKINMYQSSFNNFSNNLTNVLTDMKEDLEIAYSGNGYEMRRALKLLSNIRSDIVDSCSFKGEVQKVKDLWAKDREEVEFNYQKVYAVAKSMTGAKKIEEYLESLGFDLSTLREDEKNYLSTNIDKSKLFVCGENK